MKKNLAVFISGRGSNFQSLLDYQKQWENCSYEIVLCVSDNPNAPGLVHAQDNDIPVEVIPKMSNKTEWETKILECLERYNIGMIALAGFMSIIPHGVVERYKGWCVNIHPSLLPKYPGLNTHRRVIENKEKEHGLSIHFVDAGIDTGPVIFQVIVPVNGIDEVILSQVILIYENWFYPLVVNEVALGNLSLRPDGVYNRQTLLERPISISVQGENNETK